jgi:nicotinic acid mononucleotide adenylyltransferase
MNLISFKEFFSEATSDSVVFTFGRMNPPTVGHGKLIDKVLSVAKSSGAKAIIYPSKTEDGNKNPLPFKMKVKVLKDVYGSIVDTDKSIKNPFHALEKLDDKKVSNVTFVVGSDRVKEFEKNMSSHIKKNLSNIKNFSVVSAGERDPDSSDVSGMSGSKMRSFVQKNDFDKFRKGLITKSSKLAKTVFTLLQKKLN